MPLSTLRSVSRNGQIAGLLLVTILGGGGCFSLKKATNSLPFSSDIPIEPAEVYTLACPDAIQVFGLTPPAQPVVARIGPNGGVELPGLGSIRVEGLTVGEAAAEIAMQARLPADSIRVRVLEYASRQLFLYGQTESGPVAIDYRGPERVVDVLRRAGGLSPDAALNEIYVLRAQVSEGIPAEVLTVDLEAILRHNDHSTNVRVQPLDEIYVGEKPRSRVRRAIPTFLQPIYEGLVRLIPQVSVRSSRRTNTPMP